jgi:GDPmannose 4,6-dehydratase
MGLAKKLVLGNLNASRDWGHAKDYVKAMWMMLQQDIPGDFV